MKKYFNQDLRMFLDLNLKNLFLFNEVIKAVITG